MSFLTLIRHMFKKLLIITTAAFACIFCMTGCETIKNWFNTTLTDDQKVEKICNSMKWAGYNGTKLGISRFEESKQADVAKIFVLVSESVLLVANSDDASPDAVYAAVNKALVGNSEALRTAVTGAINVALTTYQVVWNSSIQPQLDNQKVVASCRLILVALAEGVDAGASEFIKSGVYAKAVKASVPAKSKALEAFTIEELTINN